MTSTLDEHSAAGQAAGYSYQFDIALLQLSKGSLNGRVGIETLDDVVNQDGAGNTTLIQGKNSVNEDSTPFSDNSIGLWNTLHFWCDAITNNEVNPASTWFDLITNTTIPDCLARQISLALKPEEVEACIKRINEVPSKPSVKARSHVLAVRNSPKSTLTSLIPRIRCFGKNENRDITGIHREITARLKLPNDVNAPAVIEELLGWIKVQVQHKWLAKVPAWIEQDHFNNRLQAAIDKNRRRRARELPARKLICHKADIDKHMKSGFVRQLELIDCGESEIEDGIIDFLRHNAERLRLNAEGNIGDEDWVDFDDRLVQHWKPIFQNKTSGISKNKRRKAGKNVYAEIQLHREILAGLATSEYYLTRGAYHRLADKLALGWHPDYVSLCKSFAEEA